MNSYLINLASRALGISESIRPRIPALFEPVRPLPGDLDIEQKDLIDIGQMGSKTAEQISDDSINDDSTDDEMSAQNRTNSHVKGLETNPSPVDTSEKNEKEEPFFRASSRQAGIGSKMKDAKAFESASIETLRDLSGLTDDQASKRNYGEPDEDMPKDAEAPGHANIKSNAGNNTGSNTESITRSDIRSRPVDAISPSINSVDPETEAKSDSSISEISKPKASALLSESSHPRNQYSSRPDQSAPKRIMSPPIGQHERSEISLAPVNSPAKSATALPVTMEQMGLEIDQPSKGYPSAKHQSVDQGSLNLVKINQQLINKRLMDKRFLIQPSIIRKHASSHPKASNEEVAADGQEGQPVIKVTIGRIEVKAVSRPETKSRAPAPKTQSTSLEEYLRSIRGGSR